MVLNISLPQGPILRKPKNFHQKMKLKLFSTFKIFLGVLTRASHTNNLNQIGQRVSEIIDLMTAPQQCESNPIP